MDNKDDNDVYFWVPPESDILSKLPRAFQIFSSILIKLKSGKEKDRYHQINFSDNSTIEAEKNKQIIKGL